MSLLTAFNNFWRQLNYYLKLSLNQTTIARFSLSTSLIQIWYNWIIEICKAVSQRTSKKCFNFLRTFFFFLQGKNKFTYLVDTNSLETFFNDFFNQRLLQTLSNVNFSNWSKNKFSYFEGVSIIELCPDNYVSHLTAQFSYECV